MRVAFVSARASHIIHGVPHYDAPNGRLIKALQRHYPNLALATYPDPRARPDYYTLPVPVARLETLPWPHTFPQGFRKRREYQAALQRLEADADVLIVQLPSKSFTALRALRKPVIYHVCSNVETMAANPVKYRGAKGWLARRWARWIQHEQVAAASQPQNFTVVHGDELQHVFAPARPQRVVSSSLWESEIGELPQRNAPGKSPRLLFVGRPSLEKGFDVLLDAYQALHDQGYTPSLDLVGFAEAEAHALAPGFADRLAAFGSQVTYHGTLPFGEALFDQFKTADLLVLPSRSEGTPRVLVEARAFGCPVIGSDAGGIPSSIQHQQDGWVVPAGNAAALAKAVVHLVENPELYHNLRHQGWQRVRELTVENFARTFIQLIEQVPNHE